MTTPTTNHELLQEYIDSFPRPSEIEFLNQTQISHMLEEIQSRLVIEPMEYEIEKDKKELQITIKLI